MLIPKYTYEYINVIKIKVKMTHCNQHSDVEAFKTQIKFHSFLINTFINFSLNTDKYFKNNDK